MDADVSPVTTTLILGGFEFEHALLFLGLLLITVALISRYRKQRRHLDSRSRLTPEETIERARQIRGLRGDLEQLMVEVEQLAKRFSAQLDAKAMQVEQEVSRADERIAHLRQLMEVDSPMAACGPGDEEDTSLTAEGSILDLVSTASNSHGEDALAKRVFALADAGLSAVDIARQLDEQIGKVELILALREAG